MEHNMFKNPTQLVGFPNPNPNRSRGVEFGTTENKSS